MPNNSAVPIFSIIIPAKNEEGTISACISSIKATDTPAQSYEIIVVDNGSTDATMEIAQNHGAATYRKPDFTISALRNFGASEASGKILVFLDADCTVASDWLNKASTYLARNDIVCFGSAPIIPANPTWIQSTWFVVREQKKQITDVSWLESMNMFVRREAFNAVGGFNENLVTCEDVDLSYRLASLGRIVSDKSIVAVHHGEAATIRQFLQKERWRGKSNYQGLRQHGLQMKEIPSLLLPIYYLLCIAGIFFSIIATWFSVSLAIFLFQQLPIILLCAHKLRGKYRPTSFLQLIFLYNIYYLARALSVFG